MTAELKSCPFCGDNQQLNYVELSNGLHYIECARCGAAPHRLGARSRETAVKYWNSVNRWIPCSERLPEIGENVLIYLRQPTWTENPLQVAHLLYDGLLYDGLAFELSDGEFDFPLSRVSHWQYLPEPPEKE